MNDQYILYFISRTKRKMITFIEQKLKEQSLEDIAPSYGNILTVLFNNNGKLNMKEISKLIGKDKSTVTALVNKLIKLGYVKKEKSLLDKRVTYILITEQGQNIEEKYRLISKELYERAYNNFSEEEKETLLNLLKKLNHNF